MEKYINLIQHRYNKQHQMKKSILLLILAAIMFSCSGDKKSVDAILDSENLEAIRSKRNELSQQQRDLKSDIDRLNEYIDSHEQVDRPVLITAEVIKDSLFQHYVEVQGNVDTDQNVVLNGEYSGILTQIYVKEGQKVSKGQRLAKIDDGGLSSQVAQQETQLALSKTTFERQERLWEQKIGSEIQFLQAKTNFEAAQSATNQLRSQLSKTTITAPFSGVIDDIIADLGQVITPGQTPIIRLVNLEDMYVKASIPEYVGTILQVSNFINPNNRSFDVKVKIPNKDGALKPNLIATVKVNDYTSEESITIPENILQENAEGQTIAFLYHPVNDSIGEAKRVALEIGLSYDNRVEIKSGLKKGDIIILEGAKNLRDGQKVTIKK